MDAGARFIDAMKAARDEGVAAGDVITVVGERFPRSQPRSLAHNLVALDDQAFAVGLFDQPLAAQQVDRVVGAVGERDKVYKGVWFVRGQARSAAMINEAIETGGKTGQGARRGHGVKRRALFVDAIPVWLGIRLPRSGDG